MAGTLARRTGKSGRFGGVPLPILLLVMSFCLPPEVSIQAGPLRLSPYRVILMVTVIPNLMAVMRMRSGLCAADGLMIAHGLWVILALTVSMGAAQAIESGGIYMVETVGAYLMARRYITSLADVQAVARLVVGFITLLCVAAFIESFSGVHVLRDMFKAVFGGAGAHDMDQRMGLERAFTSFEHPIIYGTFAASGFAFAYYVLGGATLRFHALLRLLVIVAATFFSLSGGPFVALGFQGFLIGWDRITRGISLRWAALAGIFAGIWVMLSLASNRSPVLLFVSYLTFSSHSAYNRVNIWIYGSAEVGRHPLFGIGFGDWIRAPWMSDSMDTFWLLTAMRYGLPSVILLLAVMLTVGVRLNRVRAASPAFKHAVKAWLVTIAGFALAALTVHMWNALMVQFYFLIGLGAALSQFPAAERIGAPARPLHPVSLPQPERITAWI